MKNRKLCFGKLQLLRSSVSQFKDGKKASNIHIPFDWKETKEWICWHKYISLYIVELTKTTARNYIENDGAKLIAIFN